MDAGFVARVAYFLAQQILKYEPLVANVNVKGGSVDGNVFTSGVALNAQTAALRVEYKIRGDNTPRNLVFPLWEYVNG